MIRNCIKEGYAIFTPSDPVVHRNKSIHVVLNFWVPSTIEVNPKISRIYICMF